MEHMEDPKQRSEIGRWSWSSIRRFHGRGGTVGSSERPPKWKATAQAGIVFLLIMASEVHMLLPEAMDNERKWEVYLATSELVKAGLCLLAMGHVPRLLAPTLFLGAVWFTTQAQQEWMGSNDGTTEQWEYLLVLAMVVAVAIQQRMSK